MKSICESSLSSLDRLRRLDVALQRRVIEERLHHEVARTEFVLSACEHVLEEAIEERPIRHHAGFRVAVVGAREGVAAWRGERDLMYDEMLEEMERRCR